MAEGLDNAAAAFAEDLGGSSQVRNRAPARHEDGDVAENDGAVERIINPSQESALEPGGGDALEEGEDREEEDRAGGDEDRDERGRFRKQPRIEQREAKEPRREHKSVEDLLDDPLDDEGAEGDEPAEQSEGDERRPVAKFDPADLDTEVEVTVDGTKAKVPLREALDGYIRQQTFHRRLTELDNAKKTFRTDREQVDQGRAFYIERLEALQKQLDGLTPAEPDWEKRFAEDPVRAGQEMQQWNKYKASREAMETERRGELQKASDARNKAFNEFVQDERVKFASAHPEYTDPADGVKRWNRDRNDMRTTALSHGFSEDEVNNIVDSRYMDVLLKASKYDRLMKRAKSLKPTSSTERNGGGASRTPPRPAAARRRLSSTGSIHDASKVFAAELAREG